MLLRSTIKYSLKRNKKTRRKKMWFSMAGQMLYINFMFAFCHLLCRLKHEMIRETLLNSLTKRDMHTIWFCFFSIATCQLQMQLHFSATTAVFRKCVGVQDQSTRTRIYVWILCIWILLSASISNVGVRNSAIEFAFTSASCCVQSKHTHK